MARGVLVWGEIFPKYGVPNRILALVRDGVLEDFSNRTEPCPSFGARNGNGKGWVRVWVEHADPAERRGWEARFTVVVQEEPFGTSGRGVLSTDDPEEAKRVVLALLRKKRLTEMGFKKP